MQILPIQAIDGIVSFLRVGHFYKREPARLSSISIPDKVDAIDLPVPSE
jgi:hypothetical protein